MNEGMTVPVKNPELNRVQEESDAALKTLIEVTNQLASRLSKVMSPPPVSPDNNKQEEAKYYSKLAQELDSQNVSIWAVIRSIRTVMERLEI